MWGFQKYGAIFLEKETALSMPVRRVRLPQIWGPLFYKKNKLRHPVRHVGLTGNTRAIFPESTTLEHYFHAAHHLIWMMLEGKLSICLVAKGPSKTVTEPREESLAVDA